MARPTGLDPAACWRATPATSNLGSLVCDGQPANLSVLLAKVLDLALWLGEGFAADANRLTESCGDCLSQGHFRLAVPGQFKRGKSTLLHALLGEAILPTAVVPLTVGTTTPECICATRTGRVLGRVLLTASRLVRDCGGGKSPRYDRRHAGPVAP